MNRLRNFDYDMVTSTFQQSHSPGNEQRDFWSSKAADTPGSRNLFGIKDPVVDALVEQVIFAKDREELVAATHALDRVLLWNAYIVPQWHRPVVWFAIWNKFGMPDKQPAYIGADINSWWIDPAREKALAGQVQERQLSALLPPLPSPFPGARRRCGASPRAGLRDRTDGYAVAWPVGLRRPQIRAGLPAFRLCEPGCAEGRDIQFLDPELGRTTRAR